MLSRRSILKVIGIAPMVTSMATLAAQAEDFHLPKTSPIDLDAVTIDGEKVMVMKWDPEPGALRHNISIYDLETGRFR